MKKNLLKIYEGFFDDLDQLNKNQDDGFRGTNANIYDEHNYILSPDRNPEFFYDLCDFCKDYYPDLPSNRNGFTQEDLNQITCLFLNRTNENTKSYFENVTSLDELQYFNNLKIIPSWCFFNCEELKSVIFPKNLEILEMFSFGYCISLEELDFPENLIDIELDAFFKCFSLKKIIFPENLKEIGRKSFYYCQSLEEVIIPKNIEKIEYAAFGGCSFLKEIIIPEKFKNRIESIFDNVNLTKVNITYI